MTLVGGVVVSAVTLGMSGAVAASEDAVSQVSGTSTDVEEANLAEEEEEESVEDSAGTSTDSSAEASEDDIVVEEEELPLNDSEDSTASSTSEETASTTAEAAASTTLEATSSTVETTSTASVAETDALPDEEESCAGEQELHVYDEADSDLELCGAGSGSQSTVGGGGDVAVTIDEIENTTASSTIETASTTLTIDSSEASSTLAIDEDTELKLLVSEQSLLVETYLDAPDVFISGETVDFPNTSYSEWALGWLERPNYQEDGLLHFSYSVWENNFTRDVGGLPFLINSHKAMIRETHQRIQRDNMGKFLHISGEKVALENIGNFLQTNKAFQWNKGGFNELIEWEDMKGNKFSPFVFKNYWGKYEALDPQWRRETFIVPQAEQVERLLREYLISVEIRRLSGDRRGTTLDLQVGAAADDSGANTANTDMTDPLSNAASWDTANTLIGVTGGPAGTRKAVNGRFLNVTVPNGATINTASLVSTAQGSFGSAPEFVIAIVDEDDPAAPTNVTTWNALVYTATRITWDFSTSWVTDTEYTTPELATLLQDIVNRAGWASGQAMLLAISDDKAISSNNYRGRQDYGTDTTKALKLHIEYTAAETESTPGKSNVQIIY